MKIMPNVENPNELYVEYSSTMRGIYELDPEVGEYVCFGWYNPEKRDCE